MQDFHVRIDLTFEGAASDAHFLDFYDASKALLGFQRSLAITTHLVLNGEVITQAPSLKNARILAAPPAAGSWEIAAIIAAGAGAYKALTAPKDTVLGHLVHSAYDYILKQTLGVHVDYDKTLGRLVQEAREQHNLPDLNRNRFDSAIEKCEPAIKDLHRPITHSQSAETAQIHALSEEEWVPVGPPINSSSVEAILEFETDDRPIDYFGSISSYNINTFKGRVYIQDLNRTIPFSIAEGARKYSKITRMTQSLLKSSEDPRALSDHGITLKAYTDRSRTGRVVRLYVVDVL